MTTMQSVSACQDCARLKRALHYLIQEFANASGKYRYTGSDENLEKVRDAGTRIKEARDNLNAHLDVCVNPSEQKKIHVPAAPPKPKGRTNPKREAVEDSVFTFPTWKPLPGYEQAACKGENVDRFHPDSNTGIREAKMVCFWCPLGKNGGVDGPLVDSCLEYAMDYEKSGDYVRQGIWGGSGPQDRHRIAKGEATSDDLFLYCARETCGEPMPVAGGKRRFCSQGCAYLARRENPAELKTCVGCETEKPVTEFPARNDRASGRHSRCRVCTREAKREREAA